MTMQLDDIAKHSASENKINWVTATFMALFHVGAVVALFFFTWKAFFVALFLYWVSGSLGIGMGYHRLLTHRSFSCPLWLERLLAIFGTCALQFSPLQG